MKVFFAALVLLWLAGGCQQAMAPHLALGPVMPDFPLIVVGTLGLFSSRRGGTLLGFFAGLVHGGVIGANLASYTLSRTVAGFLVGWFNDLEFETNPIMAFIATAFLTITANLIHMFGAPPSAIMPYLAATIGVAVVNGVLAMPLYLVLRAMLAPDR